ncbi:BNR repeat-containing protein [Horticoccus luteus]|uniref:BNR repeat-containing protein n=1 Tax=Horticoccus luteus TaxID=2862869 RepID=A0A8F9XKI5_9BACT|nr:BNR-4 repeat-containing protein [Horticoccus luteus]QYM78099.1 BNR repeat-containing protein [Horticoccus luteus]
MLSKLGSGRATAYDPASKIITSGDRTHVAWLDSTPEGFRVRVRSLNRATNEWSATVTVGEAMDNHGGPAMTIDPSGHLHVLYYPHHAPMRYRRSVRPNDASEWEPEIEFGALLSYPVVVCAKDGTLLMTARRYTEGKRTTEAQLWEKPAGGEWRLRSTLMRSRFPDYAQFGESLAWGPDHQTLHLSCRIYETAEEKKLEAWQTVGYLRSTDAGHTWTKADGTAVTLPVTAETIDVIAQGGGASGRTIAAGGIAVSPEGEPYVVHNLIEHEHGRAFVSTPAAGRWAACELNAFLPATWREEGGLYLPGALTFGGSGQLVGVLAVARPPAGVKNGYWGAASSEIACFRANAARERFSFSLLSEANAHEPHWLPNIERPTGFNRVPDAPGVIYTAGAAGGGLKDILTNKVWWCTVA